MYEVQVDMRLSRQENIMAYGTVTINRAIRFMVQLRKSRDTDNKEKIFISYPRKEADGKWDDVISPDEDVKRQIEEAVTSAIKNEILRDLHLPPVEIVEITAVEPNADKKVPICGVATIKISGLTISGITIKRGKKGLFCNMPQYRQPDGNYRDLVYAITKDLQMKINTAVISAYEKKIKNG